MNENFAWLRNRNMLAFMLYKDYLSHTGFLPLRNIQEWLRNSVYTL